MWATVKVSMTGMCPVSRTRPPLGRLDDLPSFPDATCAQQKGLTLADAQACQS